jgi:aminodeoxyfutalosine synthase
MTAPRIDKTVISIEDAQAILADRNVIAVGARGDDERRRRHGDRTTFVRVFEIHTDAVPASLPAGTAAGEIRLIGKPPSVVAALASVTAACALSGATPLSGYSLADLLELAGGTPAGLSDLAGRLRSVGLTTVAEAPIDLLPDAVEAIRAARLGGLDVPRLTVQHGAEHPLRVVALARTVQAALGGVRAFAPLPRVSSVAQPTTGYDDVRRIAVARLMVDNIDCIQVDWALYGPKLAQVALTMGADDVDGVSALEGDLGRRRSPIEEIRGNITAAGLDPVERDARFLPLVPSKEASSSGVDS